MVESPAFILGLFAGLVLLALAIGLWWSTRLRSQFEAQVLGAAERAQRADIANRALESRARVNLERVERNH